MSRFRLRTLLIVVTLIAIYLANASRNVSLQKRFIERVDRTGWLRSLRLAVCEHGIQSECSSSAAAVATALGG